ncbi:FAD-binding oxidoreductase [Haliangium sp.]|uniref:FAD-binding oxidoreductase n=1 Tax=Haliangium sp. TaxID=2663208 RepID=UPI003D1528E1
MARPLEYNASVVERIDVNATLAIFRIALDQPPGPDWYVPGQYCVLGLNQGEDSVRRAMTMTSAPQQVGPLEFYIRYVDEPTSALPFTHLLWRCRVGDRLYLRAHPAGAFTVAATVGADDPRLRLLCADDTGLAPFLSVLRAELARDPEADLSRYLLLHGVARGCDLGFRDELGRMARVHGLRYLGVVSDAEEGAEASATGAEAAASEADARDLVIEPRGLPGVLARERREAVEARLGLAAGTLSPARAVVYLCGLKAVIGACMQALLERGFLPDHGRLRRLLDDAPEASGPSVFFEQYDPGPVLALRDPAVVAAVRAAWAARPG